MKDYQIGILLSITKYLPRGRFHVGRFLAKRFPALQRLPISLRLIPEARLEADLRESVWYPLWKFGCYPHQLAEDILAQRLLRFGDSVWDVGANIGYTAILYAHIVGDKGEVIAIEPSPKAFAYLDHNILSWANIRAINMAVSDRNMYIDFVETPSLNLSYVPSNDDSDRRTKVRGITLDSLLLKDAYRPPDFLKVDVEGHEPQVFRGGERLIRTHRPLIEFEALSVEALKKCCSILDLFSEGKYQIYQVLRCGKLVKVGQRTNTQDARNFLALTKMHRERFNAVEFV